MHLEAMIERGWRCTSRPRSSELRDAPGRLDRGSLAMHFEAACKGTYASVRPYRRTYGNYGIRLQTWTRVIVNIGV